MTRIRVALFENPTLAEPTRQRLVQAGIRAEIHCESGIVRLWFVSKARAGVRLEVPSKDAERAQLLLAQWDAERGLLQNAIHCPECNSLRIEFPQFTEKSLLTNLAMGLMAECRLLERLFYCEDCHCVWAPESKPQRLREHSAPNYFLENLAEDKHSPAGSVCGPESTAPLRRRSLQVPNRRKRRAPSGPKG